MVLRRNSLQLFRRKPSNWTACTPETSNCFAASRPAGRLARKIPASFAPQAVQPDGLRARSPQVLRRKPSSRTACARDPWTVCTASRPAGRIARKINAIVAPQAVQSDGLRARTPPSFAPQVVQPDGLRARPLENLHRKPPSRTACAQDPANCAPQAVQPDGLRARSPQILRRKPSSRTACARDPCKVCGLRARSPQVLRRPAGRLAREIPAKFAPQAV